VAVGLLALAVGAGVVWARTSSGETVPVQRAAVVQAPAPSTPPATGWASVVHDLDLARAAAFANADATVLAQVDAPGSAALRTDRLAVAALAAAGVHARGYAVATSSVVASSAGPADAVLLVVDRRSAYELVDVRGVVVSTQPARQDERWRVHLVRVAGDWLVADVSPAASAGSAGSAGEAGVGSVDPAVVRSSCQCAPA